MMRRLWHAILAAPVVPIYLYFGALGVATLAAGRGFTPVSLRDALPWWMVGLWTLAVAAGGVTATIGVVVRGTRVESCGAALLAWGAALYGVAVGVVGWPRGLTAAAISAAVTSMCLIRLRGLSRARHAARITEDLVAGDDAR